MTVILFDYGGVLGDHHLLKAEVELSDFLGVEVAAVRALLSERSEQGRLIREGRLSEVEFWSRVAALAGLDYLPAPPSALTEAWCRTYKPNETVFNIVRRLRSVATTGVVTNIDPGRSEYLLNTVRILDLVDLYYPSFEFGLTKQDSEFWVALRRRIDADLERPRIMYVDDRVEHVNSAIAIGFSGHLYDGNGDRLVQALSSWLQIGRVEGIF